MPPKISAVLQRRTNDLIANFPSCLDKFDGAHLFTGPSVYFHHKTSKLLQKYGNVADAITSTDFMESLYATLTSWGMHRMGKTNAKLADFEIMKYSFLELSPQLERLQNVNLTNLDANEIPEIARQVWYIIKSLQVGVGAVKIVAGSKALHHVLPNLVPPIDREYTLQFFYRSKNIDLNGEKKFQEIFPFFQQIAILRQDEIYRSLAVRGEMHSSLTKVIDNAIVGYVLKYLKNDASTESQESEQLNLSDEKTTQKLSVGLMITPHLEGKISEQILWAVNQLVTQGNSIFERKEIRAVLGIDPKIWGASYNPAFQGMRADHPGGAAPLAKHFQGIFERVEYGKYRLTEYGSSLISDLNQISHS